MPEMTGLEVCRALRADPATSGVRIMLLSAAVHPARGHAGRPERPDADDYAAQALPRKEARGETRDRRPHVE